MLVYGGKKNQKKGEENNVIMQMQVRCELDQGSLVREVGRRIPAHIS